MNRLVYAYNECKDRFSEDRDKLILRLLDQTLNQNLYFYYDLLDKKSKKIIFEIESSDNLKNILRYEKEFIKIEDKTTNRGKQYD